MLTVSDYGDDDDALLGPKSPECTLV